MHAKHTIYISSSFTVSRRNEWMGYICNAQSAIRSMTLKWRMHWFRRLIQCALDEILNFSSFFWTLGTAYMVRFRGQSGFQYLLSKQMSFFHNLLIICGAVFLFRTSSRISILWALFKLINDKNDKIFY